MDQCNDGAKKMSNLEQMMEIDHVIDFKSTKVSHALDLLHCTIHCMMRVESG